MLDEDPASFELFWTLRTLPKHICRMDPQMVVKCTGLIEALSTFLTDVILLIGMDSLVSVEITDVTE